ncbi:TlpA disulfide reductase family protein [Bacteroides sp.]|uniref:TlpA family protein disulfide reductase n=1 Tax=Bacteroides sp. TaxID=29523 RepID=UPI00260CF9BB|nr:TlpA disulfide reductase family protein [Bacteroides sp.]MDD3039406.1 TlpA disulfide reductase family protein [Bacteroides sp.]
MRKVTWIMSFLFCTLCMVQAKDRVIECPPFTAWNSTTLEIEKIVLSDTSTTIYIKAFYEPKHWIKIDAGSILKDNNGNLYPIRKGIGITLDKEFWMPESGEAEFQLIFPPLPKNVTFVDFIEGNDEKASKIWGIQLNKKAFEKQKLPQEVIVHKINKKAALPIPKLSYGTAVLKGRILDYQKDMPSECRIHVFNPAFREDNTSYLKINADGTFQTEIGIPTVTNVALTFPYGNVLCLVAPHEETYLTINPKELCRQQSRLQKKTKSYGATAYFKGYLASLQQEFLTVDLDMTLGDHDYMAHLKAIAGKSAEEYKNYILKSIPTIRKKIAQSKYSEACKELLNIQLDIIATFCIATTIRDLEYAYIKINKLDREKAAEYFKNNPINTPEEYYNVLKEFSSINTTKALYNDRYASMVNILDIIPDKENVLKEALGTDKGSLFDYIEVKKIYSALKDLTPLTAEQKVQLEKLSSPAYTELLTQTNKKLLETIELNKKKSGFTINEAGEVINEELFPSIISKYRGYVLMVDFWTTWCGPCLRAHKALMPMKKELKDKDIIYLYITGETSPKEIWDKMIPDIHGEHFRVKDNQWDYLIENLNIRGVPTYLIIDRKGNISYRETGLSKVEVIKDQLMNALDK